MNTAVQSRSEQVEERAARYLARKQEAGWSAEDRRELDAWLQESTAHEVAYYRMEYGWTKVDRMVVLKGAAHLTAEDPPLPSPLSPSGNKPSQADAERTRRHYVALAASLAVAAAGLFVWRAGVLETWLRPSYATDVGGHQTVTLGDGSRVELNTNTRVRTDVNETRRTVWVDRGEAYFDVTQDPTRPFVVYAGERRVTVLGTKFSVRRDDDRVRVAVTDGKVQLEDLRLQPSMPQVVQGGDVAVAVRASTPRVESKGVEQVTRALTWRQGLVTFDRTTLAEAAMEFNRYNRRQLIVTEEVSGIGIGGSFEATNVEAFVRLLREGFGLRVVEDGGQFRISN